MDVSKQWQKCAGIGLGILLVLSLGMGLMAGCSREERWSPGSSKSYKVNEHDLEQLKRINRIQQDNERALDKVDKGKD